METALTDGSLARQGTTPAFPANEEAAPSRAELLIALGHGRAGTHLLMVAFDQGVSWNMLSDEMVDRVESTVLARLRRVVGRQGVYRGSRNTFIVVLNELDDTSAISTAEHLVEVVNRAMLLSGQAVHVRSAVGVTTIDSNTPAETNLRHARIALMAACQVSKGSVSIFTSAMLEVAEERRATSHDLLDQQNCRPKVHTFSWA